MTDLSNTTPDQGTYRSVPKIGFFFWPFNPDLIATLGRLAEMHRFDMVGVADTPGQCLDTWVAATLLSAAAPSIPMAVCVTNFTSRHWTTTATAAASLAALHRPGFTLGLGAGHSAMRNFGMRGATIAEMTHGLTSIRGLLRGEAIPNGDSAAHVPWIRDVPDVFLAASHPRSLQLGGRQADGVFVNYGLLPETLRESDTLVTEAGQERARPPARWQAANLDCTEDGDIARRAVGKMCAFTAGYVIGRREPTERGVPVELAPAMRQLVQEYSTRPSEADSDLVERLGLSEYLRSRFAVAGTPDECAAQIQAAAAAGVERIMFSVSRAYDPVATVDLIGRYVLPKLRARVQIETAAPRG